MKGDNKCSTYHAYIMIILEITFFYQNFIGRFFFFSLYFICFWTFFALLEYFVFYICGYISVSSTTIISLSTVFEK